MNSIDVIRETTKEDPNFIFLIISFKEEINHTYEALKEVGKKYGYTIQRVKDTEKEDYRITEEIFRMIHKSTMIIADLTYDRPNVYFELGYARGLDKKVITFAKKRLYNSSI